MKIIYPGLAALSAVALLSVSAWADPLKIMVVSDIHVYNDAHVQPNFPRVVKAIVAMHPRAVVITGDSTSGNLHDHFRLSRVRAWWRTLAQSIAPLQAAGIDVLPVAGNHDYYRDVQRQAYAEAARAILAANPTKPALSGHAPLYYSTEIEGTHLDLLHIVDQDIAADEQEWLAQDLAAATDAKVKLAFGHVPLHSNMGKTSGGFLNTLGKTFLDGGLAAYVAGHEHLFWDEKISAGGRELREVTVGTSSAAYMTPLSPATYGAHCKGTICTVPATGEEIALKPGSRLERNEVNFVELEIDGAQLSVHPYTLGADGSAAPFSVSKP